MDIASVSAAMTAIRAAKDLASSAMALRDRSLIAEKIGLMNDQLLHAQDALFTHNTQLLALQNQYFERAEKLRKAEEALVERGRYTLVCVGNGKLAYRVNLKPKIGGTCDPGIAEAEHYVCQACFDNGRKVVLQHSAACGGEFLYCPACKVNLKIKEY